MRQGPSEGLDMISFRQAWSLLASLSIVVVDKSMTRMHPVTHMWAKDRLKSQHDVRDAWLGALAVLSFSIKEPSEQFAWWPHLRPHIECLCGNLPDEFLRPGTISLGQSFYRLSIVLYALRADKAIIELLQKSFINADQSSTHLHYAHHIQELYGQCLIRTGDFKKAMQWLEPVVNRRPISSSPQDLDLFNSKLNLARAYKGMGHTNKAKDLFEHVVKMQTSILKLADASFPYAQHELAGVYRDLNEKTKAKHLLEHVVKKGAEIFRPEDPLHLTSKFHLALTYISLKEYNEAKDHLEQVVKSKAETLRPEHPLRLASKRLLTLAYYRTGEMIKAKEQQEEIVATEVKPSDPIYLDSFTAEILLKECEDCLRFDEVD